VVRHGDQQGPALSRRGRLALIGAAALVALGVAVVLVLQRLPHHAHVVLGSTSTEYVPTTPRRTRPPKPAPGVEWPTYGFDNARRRAISLRLPPPYRQSWVFHGRALLEFPPAVAYGRVYLPTFDGRFYALDAATGRVLWRRRAGRCGWASPAVAAHVVYVTFIGSPECGSRRPGGEVDAFDARTGAMRWRREIGPTESSPLVAGGMVLVGDWNGDVWALDARTGRTRWRTHTGGAVKGSLAFGDGRLFIGNYAGQMLALAPRTGRVLWESGGHGSFYSSPAVAYGRVYVGSLDDGVYAFGAATGDLLWSRPTGGYVYASPAVWNGLVLVGSYDHDFYALDAGTGAVRWRFQANGPISGAASVIGGLVWFSTFAERTYALEASTGHQVVVRSDGKYSPAVAEPDRLYLVGLGRLYALRAGSGAPRGSRAARAPAARERSRRSS
jgi:outer membrane protein assembly factor BamB